MSGSQDDRSAERLSVVGLNAHYPVILDDQPVHACLEMHFSSTVQDGISHVLNDPWKLVGTDMRMCVRQDGRTGSVLTEYVQDFFHAAPFLASGIELSVGVGSGSSFTETVVGFCIYLVVTTDACKVQFPVPYIFTPLYDNGTQSPLDEAQCCKESSRSCTDHDDLRPSFHVAVFGLYELFFGRLFVDKYLSLDVDENGPLPGINTLLQYPDCMYGTYIQPLFPADILLERLFTGCLFGQNS